MRIDLTNSTASQIGTQPDAPQVSSAEVSAAAAAGTEDRTTLTSGSTSVQSLVNLAMHSPEIRQDRVASLQQAVSSGQYKLDPAAIAASMIDEHA